MIDRGNSNAGDVRSFGPFKLYPSERRLQKDGEPVSLGGRALDILIALTERAGQIVTRGQLIAIAWPNVVVEEGNLRVHIAALQRALGEREDGSRYIANVSGRGYSFVAPISRSSAEAPRPVANISTATQSQRLPARPSRMVGRDDTVLRLAEQLQSVRFVSLVGPGGVGKTTVAISVAHELFEGFGGSVYFIDLGALTDPQLVPTAVASALGFMIQRNDPLASLITFIGNKSVLLLLDNCEHVIDVAAALAERIFREAPGVHILATSREALRVEGEHVQLLHSLDCPPEHAGLTAAEALRYPAAQLFMERAAASGYDVPLSDADAPIVAGICQRLDGVALAIVLAAGRVGSLGIRATADLLDNRFSLLWYARRTALPRHETINAMLDWSYSLLSEREKTVLCRLSIFVGDFTLEAAISVASESEQDEAVIDVIASLVAKSLISTKFVDRLTYHRLLETTRAYAAAKLSARNEGERTARRHAMFYCGLLAHDDFVEPALDERDLSEYAPHVGNVRSALGWAFSEAGSTAIGAELASLAASLFIGLSLLEECREWCKRALAALDAATRGTRREMMLQEALALSTMYTEGHNDDVRQALERGLDLADSFQDRVRQLRLLAGLNMFYLRLGDIGRALAMAERGAGAAQLARHPAGIAWSECWIGNARHFLGDQTAAHLHCLRSLDLSAQLGRSTANFFGFDQRVRALVNLARALLLRGFADQARGAAQDAMDEAASRNHPVSVCFAQGYAALLLLWTGDLHRADELIEQLMASSARYSLEPYRALGLALKGELAIIRNDPEAGLDLLRSALGALRTQHYSLVETLFLCALAEALYRTGQFEKAVAVVDGGIARAATSGIRFDLPELLRIKSQLLSKQDDRVSAMALLVEAIAVARDQSALALELRSTMSLARMLAADGQRAEARLRLAQIYDTFTEGFETADLTEARALLKDLQ